MKTSKRNKLLGLALMGSLSLFSASNAHAAAGDPIANTATLSFSVGGAGQTPINAGTSFVEDRVINFTVVREGGTVNVAPNATGQAIPFLVGNTGNGTHGFLMVGVHNSGVADPHGGTPDVFTPETAPSYKTYVDSDNNGTLDPIEIADANSYIPSLAPGAGPAPGGTVRVFVVADIPADSRVPNPLVNDDVAVVSLVAHASANGTAGIITDAIISDDNAHNSPGGTFNGNAGPIAIPAGAVVLPNPDGTGTMETVFADLVFTDANSGVTVDANGDPDTDYNAQQSSFSSYTVLTAALTVTKASVAWWDPINANVSPKAIPTGFVQYTITIANAASAANADLTTISDALNASLRLDQDFGDGSALNPPANAAGDSIEITHVTNGVTVYCTGDETDTDTDGCGYSLPVASYGGTVSVNILAVMTAQATAADATLTAGESLTVKFNAEIQ